MKKYVITVLVLIFLFGFLIPPVYCQSYKTTGTSKSTASGEKMLVDLLIVRPLGILSCAVGFVATVITIPFVATSQDSSARVVDEFLTKPGNFTFTRPLGEDI